MDDYVRGEMVASCQRSMRWLNRAGADLAEGVEATREALQRWSLNPDLAPTEVSDELERMARALSEAVISYRRFAVTRLGTDSEGM